MGQKRARLRTFAQDVDGVVRFISEYQQALRELLDTIPPDVINPQMQPYAVVGRAELWPCADAAVVLIYRNPINDISVTVRDPLSKTAAEFLRLGSAAEMIEPDGRPSAARFALTGGYLDTVTWCTPFILARRDGTYVRSRFDKLVIFPWDAEFADPRGHAVDAFRSDFAARNLLREAPVLFGTVPPSPERSAAQLLADYRNLLRNSGREEDIQQFLADHPVLLYPDYLAVYPKHRLGIEYVTDFVFVVQSYNGAEYVFVEIEHPTKQILTQSGQFSAAFTQAKDQLLNWEQWITTNYAYASAQLPNLYRPAFHLIIGRSQMLSDATRQKILTEFGGTSRRFSTFDDIADRFEQIVNRLAGLHASHRAG